MNDFVIAKNPDAASSLPYLLCLPLEDGDVWLKSQGNLAARHVPLLSSRSAAARGRVRDPPTGGRHDLQAPRPGN